jgi:hypothetical protein
MIGAKDGAEDVIPALHLSDLPRSSPLLARASYLPRFRLKKLPSSVTQQDPPASRTIHPQHLLKRPLVVRSYGP